MFFSVYTLGCKLNQLETEAITDSFCREGFTFIPWDAGESVSPEHGAAGPSIMVINTCTVTSMAEQKARRIIRKALKENPGACLIITGCYAQMEKAALLALEAEQSSVEQSSVEQSSVEQSSVEGGRLFVIPGDKKDRIMDLPRYLAGAGVIPGAGRGGACFPYRPALPELIASWLGSFVRIREGEDGAFRFRPENFFSHSRGFLKIQDGCDNHCAYCRVSLARGKSRSLGAAEVLRELRYLEGRGFAEAVLTGVNITQYRDSDLAFPGLPGLLDFLLRETGEIRLRLSSVEPDVFTSDQGAKSFARVLANPRIRPHFHLSLQSGSASILEKMGRRYMPEDIEKTVTLLRSVREDPFLACDIIAGFPGETEREFEQTRELCERIDFAWIHAFPYSRRPGTAAYHFSGKPGEKDAARRTGLLTDLARKGRRDYLGRWEGKEVEAIVEKGNGTPKCFVPGVSENYLRLHIAYGGDPAPAPGSLILCRICRNEVLRNGVPRNPGRRIDALAEKIRDLRPETHAEAAAQGAWTVNPLEN